MQAKKIQRATKLQLLTAREVQAAGDGDHFDGGGLILRVRGASAAWLFRFTSPVTGKRREFGLGTAHRGSLEQAGKSLVAARDSAHDARQVLRAGGDPIQARNAQRDQDKQVAEAQQAVKERELWTLARCARDYHARVIEPNRSRVHAAHWIASLENHVPGRLWHQPIADITAPELLKALNAIKPHKRATKRGDPKLTETTHRVRQRLDAVFEDAAFHGRCTTNPAAAVRRKLTEAVPTRRKKSQRHAPYKEAREIFNIIAQAGGDAARALELAMLCASRTSEALYAQWSEFNLDERIWTIPGARMKGGEDHKVSLSSRAHALLEAQRGHDDRYVFVSPIPDRHGKARPFCKDAMRAVLKRTGLLQRTTVHGLRHTFSTWANDTGAARADVIEACLAHKEEDRVRGAYNKAEFADERRALLQAWTDYLSRPPAQVVPIDTRKRA
jgi:integrase